MCGISLCTRGARDAWSRGRSTAALDDRSAAVPLESLTICEWSDTSRNDEVVSDPAWPRIESAIRQLDNETWNDIYLRPIGEPVETYLAVGGGAGCYVVTGSEAGERFPTLENPNGSESELVPLCVGGQVGEYPSRYVVDLEAALAAARRFYDAGGFDCGVSWCYW
jgi:hypothetical protein